MFALDQYPATQITKNDISSVVGKRVFLPITATENNCCSQSFVALLVSDTSTFCRAKVSAPGNIDVVILCCFCRQRRKETASSRSRDSVLSTDTLRGHELLAEMPERVVGLVDEMLRERDRVREYRPTGDDTARTGCVRRNYRARPSARFGRSYCR